MSNSLIYFCALICATCATIDVCIPNPLKHYDHKKPQEAFEQLKVEVKATLADMDDANKIGHVDLDLTHPAIRLYGTMDDLVIYNLSKYTMCLLDVDMEQEKFDVFNLTFHDIYLEGMYNFDGNIGELFRIFGDGPFWIRMSNFSIAMTNFNLIINEEICFPINIDIHLGQMRNHFDGLFKDEELEDLFNRALEAIGPDIFDILWSEAKEKIDGSLEEAINKIIQGQTFSDALGIILMQKDAGGLICFGSDENNN